ncbi:hypothetical protein ROZALSC1DRAFT_22824 [Rozella allomycis CSF55]|uniref:Uncharacterized protein n=1 Tax=Rozella allomycis (strain CSF55) TaxID=988480 RepID=A0A4P9YH27_ROZAC|nr:hypothetical protein ROZALSC1DRAFT_22824 [Rozella allomycis CSF55]
MLQLFVIFTVVTFALCHPPRVSKYNLAPMAAGAVKKVAELKRSTSTANDTPLCANIAFLRFLKNELTTANVINEAQLPVIARHISCLPSKELEKIPWTTMEPRKFQGLVSNLPKDLQSVVSIKAENVFIPKGIANINTLHKIVDVIVDPKKDINDWGLSDLFSFLKVTEH